MKYRAIVYDKYNKSFWKYSQIKYNKETAQLAGELIAKRHGIKNPEIIITETFTK